MYNTSTLHLLYPVALYIFKFSLHGNYPAISVVNYWHPKEVYVHILFLNSYLDISWCTQEMTFGMIIANGCGKRPSMYVSENVRSNSRLHVYLMEMFPGSYITNSVEYSIRDTYDVFKVTKFVPNDTTNMSTECGEILVETIKVPSHTIDRLASIVIARRACDKKFVFLSYLHRDAKPVPELFKLVL